MHARTCNECVDILRYDAHLVTSVGFHISVCFSHQLCRHVLFCVFFFVFFSGKIQSVLAYLSSSGLLNMQLEWNGRVGFAQSNCSGSGGQGNLEELKQSRRNGTWPLRLAVRDSCWLPVKKRSLSAAQLSKSYIMLLLVDYVQGALH